MIDDFYDIDFADVATIGLARESLGNVDRVHLIVPDQLNTYDVLVSDDIVFTRGALETFLAGPVRGKGAKAVATESEAATDSGSDQ